MESCYVESKERAIAFKNQIVDDTSFRCIDNHDTKSLEDMNHLYISLYRTSITTLYKVPSSARHNNIISRTTSQHGQQSNSHSTFVAGALGNGLWWVYLFYLCIACVSFPSGFWDVIVAFLQVFNTPWLLKSKQTHATLTRTATVETVSRGAFSIDVSVENASNL